MSLIPQDQEIDGEDLDQLQFLIETFPQSAFSLLNAYIRNLGMKLVLHPLHEGR